MTAGWKTLLWPVEKDIKNHLALSKVQEFLDKATVIL